MKLFKSTVLHTFLLSGLLITSFSCQEPEEKDNRSLSLSVSDSDPISANLSLQTQNLKLPATLTLIRNGETSQSFTLFQTDTILTEIGLVPQNTYNWQILLKNGEKTSKTSNVASVTTQDTTSHNFLFSLIELGGSGTSINDVFIVNENDIWVAGDIVVNYSKDEVYNLMHWNGTDWEKFRLEFRFDYETATLFAYNEASSVFITPEKRIWVMSSSGGVSFSDNSGLSWIQSDKLKGIGLAGMRIWGTGNSNLYFIGLGGGILYYDGISFTKLPKLTTYNLTDIWGNSEGVFAMADKYAQTWDTPIVKLAGKSATIFPNQTEINLNQQTGIWITEKNKYLAAGALFRFDEKKQLWKHVSISFQNTDIWPYAIRGNSDTDFWVCDEFSHLVHFNGATWKWYPEVNNMGIQKFYFARMAVSGNTMVALGFANNRDYLVIGKRK